MKFYEKMSKIKNFQARKKNVLADALVLNERKEPVLQILGQLYMRLEFWNRPADDEILKGGMKAPVKALYEELKVDKISLPLKHLFRVWIISTIHGMMPCTESNDGR